jgi:hypothetical protein
MVISAGTMMPRWAAVAVVWAVMGAMMLIAMRPSA